MQAEELSNGNNRLQRIQNRLADAEIDWLYLTPGPNMTYATGHVASAPAARLDKVRLKAALIPALGNAVFISPALTANNVRATTWIDEVIVPAATDTHFSTIRQVIGDGKGGALRIGIDEKLMWGIAQRLLAHLPEGSELVDVTPMLHELRLVKDADEIGLLRRASQIADAALARAIAAIEPGKTEIQIANEIVLGVREAGGTCTLSQVVSGAGRYPEDPTDKRIEKGDVLTLDVNAVYGGYYADETRVAVVGPPDHEQQHVHQVVLRANEAARAAVKPGVSGGDVHDAGVAVIVEGNYGQYFSHGVGHGLGVEGHEAPYLTHGSTDILQVGMIHTIEPAIYGRDIDKFSIRLEDVVLVTENGAQLLTTHSHDLIQV